MALPDGRVPDHALSLRYPAPVRWTPVRQVLRLLAAAVLVSAAAGCTGGSSPASAEGERPAEPRVMAVNRSGIDGGFQPPKDGSHGGTEEVPRGAA